MRCKGTTASFIICKSWTSLHLPFDFFIPKIGVLHGLLQGINSPCSFKFSIVSFNPSLTSGFSGYCSLCANKCGSLSWTTTGIAFCAQPTDFPSALTLGFTFSSLKGEKGKTPYSWKERHVTCSVYLSPKGVRETLAWSETHVKIAQSPSHNLQKNWSNIFCLIQTVPLQKWMGKKVA